METLQFACEIQRGGARVASFNVSAVESALVGIYFNGAPYVPDMPESANAAPYHYRAAIERAAIWATDMSDVLHAELRTTRGKAMGTLFARAIWKEKRCRLEGWSHGHLRAVAREGFNGAPWQIASDCGAVSIRVSDSLARNRFYNAEKDSAFPVFYYE